MPEPAGLAGLVEGGRVEVRRAALLQQRETGVGWGRELPGKGAGKASRRSALRGAEPSAARGPSELALAGLAGDTRAGGRFQAGACALARPARRSAAVPYRPETTRPILVHATAAAMALTVLEQVGIVFILIVAVQLVRRLLQLFYDHIVAPTLHLNVDFTKFKGTWAGRPPAVRLSLADDGVTVRGWGGAGCGREVPRVTPHFGTADQLAIRREPSPASVS